MEVGMAFWPAKVLLSAIELRLFTALGARCDDRRRAAGGASACTRAPTPISSTRWWRCASSSATATAPTPATATPPRPRLFLDRNSPQFMGGFLEMANARLYPFWGDLTEGLRTGRPQNEIKHTGASMFAELYSKPERLEQFMDAMSGHLRRQLPGLRREVRLLPLPDALRRRRRDRPALDARRQAAPAHALHVRRPAARPPRIAERKIAAAGLADRVTAMLDRLLRRAAAEGRRDHDGHDPPRLEPGEEDAPDPRGLRGAAPGGAFVVVENLIDDARRENAFGLMMSLNMLIEFGEAFDFTAADFFGWCREAGFRTMEVIPLAGPASAGVAYK